MELRVLEEVLALMVLLGYSDREQAQQATTLQVVVEVGMEAEAPMLPEVAVDHPILMV